MLNWHSLRGARTLEDVYNLGNATFAALQFPVPKDADYIFFQPDDEAQTFDELIAEIALLDETYEHKGLDFEEYQLKRRALLDKAKQLA